MSLICLIADKKKEELLLKALHLALELHKQVKLAKKDVDGLTFGDRLKSLKKKEEIGKLCKELPEFNKLRGAEKGKYE